MHIKANGITFNYQIDGAQHAPWLIFSNSLATNFSMWDGQTRSLSGSFRILRYDQRGHGKTEAPEAPLSIRNIISRRRRPDGRFRNSRRISPHGHVCFTPES